MKLKILSWNVRGLNNFHKREVVKNLLKELKGDVICLQEIKLDSTNSTIVKSLWGNPFVDWAALDAIHTAGGFWLAWDRRVFEKVDYFVGRFSVSVLLKGVVDGFQWVCSGVYGPTVDSTRNEMRVELDSKRSRWSSAWCLIGDFNIISYAVERLGCNSFSSAMFKFSYFTEKHNMVDLPLVGGDYTWFHDSENPSMSRIDRTLISADWEDHIMDVDPEDSSSGGVRPLSYFSGGRRCVEGEECF
ncbi:hypothetical protein ACB098_12G079000 [Castanea mollissima]